jgi:hypothetical protein
MPARQFFLMYKEARRLHAWRMTEYADLAAIPLCKPEYQTKLKQHYFGRINTLDNIQKQKPVSANPVLSDKEAKRAFMHLFGLKKRTVH